MYYLHYLSGDESVVLHLDKHSIKLRSGLYQPSCFGGEIAYFYYFAFTSLEIAKVIKLEDDLC